MVKKTAPSVNTGFVPLLMNGLQGRMLQLPPLRRQKRQFLVIYGQQASLEHWLPFAHELNRYGAVTMPDLPGFGGMQAFYKIHEKPTIDNFADYLAAFIKLRFRNKRFTVVGIGFGFVIVTRMLQRYPQLAKKVDLVINLGGLARYDDITFSRAKRWFYRIFYRLLAIRLLSIFIRHVGLHPTLLSSWYERRPKPPLNINEAVSLWRRNDLSTYFMTASQLLYLDNCRQTLNLPLWQVSYHANQLIASDQLAQHVRIAYAHVEEVYSRLKSQKIGTLDYNPQTTRLLPAKIHRALAK